MGSFFKQFLPIFTAKPKNHFKIAANCYKILNISLSQQNFLYPLGLSRLWCILVKENPKIVYEKISVSQIKEVKTRAPGIHIKRSILFHAPGIRFLPAARILGLVFSGARYRTPLGQAIVSCLDRGTRVPVFFTRYPNKDIFLGIFQKTAITRQYNSIFNIQPLTSVYTPALVGPGSIFPLPCLWLGLGQIPQYYPLLDPALFL